MWSSAQNSYNVILREAPLYLDHEHVVVGLETILEANDVGVACVGGGKASRKI